jgi:hypothetical protein
LGVDVDQDTQALKRCTRCDEDKPLDDFGRRADSGKPLSWCRPCFREYRREWSKTDRANRPEHYTEKQRQQWTGHSTEEVLAMVAAQGGRCAICPRVLDTTDRRRMPVDHDHACCPGQRRCGKCTRGVLCPRCNSVLGLVQDDPALLEAMVLYLMPADGEHVETVTV